LVRRLVSIGTVLLALAQGACGSAAPPASAPSALSGKPLPTFKRATLDGGSIDTKELKGRVVVVKFFAEYCAPCQKTLPAAEELHKSNPDIVVLGVSEDERQSTARELVSRYQLSFPVVHDAGQILAGRFRVTEMPATFVAGRDGTIQWVGDAEQDHDALERAVASLR
jgi:peroxiredoxin